MRSMAVSQPAAPSALAEAVRQELIAAGLPVLPWQPREAFPGTEATGYRVERDADDYRPGELLVLEQQSGPTWRDPVGPPLAGLGGYLPGVRVRLTEGVHAGFITAVVEARHTTSLDGPPDVYLVEHPQGTGELQVSATAVELAYEDT
ncbi:hypothetical protein LQ51_24955 [Micromonospora sp. HK10]|nr:hypothetical protein LQ51_24955 [Micromonospora sp. HK10]